MPQHMTMRALVAELDRLLALGFDATWVDYEAQVLTLGCRDCIAHFIDGQATHARECPKSFEAMMARMTVGPHGVT